MKGCLNNHHEEEEKIEVKCDLNEERENKEEQKNDEKVHKGEDGHKEQEHKKGRLLAENDNELCFDDKAYERISKKQRRLARQLSYDYKDEPAIWHKRIKR